MQISSTRMNVQSFAKPAAAPAAAPEQNEAPADSFTFSRAAGRYSGGQVLSRAAGGAITGALAHYIGDGSVGGTAKLGAIVNGTIGAGMGALGGAALGGAAGGGDGAATGAVIGAVGGGAIGAIGGGIKGALIGVIGNALGGGPVAFAASGAILGVI